MSKQAINRSAIVNAFTLAMSSVIETSVHAAQAGVSCEGEVRDNVVRLSAQCGADRGLYLGIVVETLGNGAHHKADGYVGGTVRDHLTSIVDTDAEGNVEQVYTPGTIKVLLSVARNAAQWLADVNHKATDDKGVPLSLRKLAKLNKDATGTTVVKAEAVKPLTFEQMVAKVGMAVAIRKIAKMLREATATESLAKTVSAIAEQVAATN